MVMHHISQSIIQKYHFAMFKVKARIVFTRSSEILKLLQPKLVCCTSSQDFLTGRETEKWFGWTRLLPLLAIPISKAGVNTVPIKKMWKEHCFCNEYTCFFFWGGGGGGGGVNGSSV